MSICWFFAGLRKVYPYYFTFKTYAKRRWYGQSLVSVFLKEFQNATADRIVCVISFLLLFPGVIVVKLVHWNCRGLLFGQITVIGAVMWPNTKENMNSYCDPVWFSLWSVYTDIFFSFIVIIVSNDNRVLSLRRCSLGGCYFWCYLCHWHPSVLYCGLWNRSKKEPEYNHSFTRVCL